MVPENRNLKIEDNLRQTHVTMSPQRLSDNVDQITDLQLPDAPMLRNPIPGIKKGVIPSEQPLFYLTRKIPD